MTAQGGGQPFKMQQTARPGHHGSASQTLKTAVSSELIGAEGGNRTRTVLADRGILSPLRLPIPPPPQAPQKELSTLPYFTQARSVHTSTQNTR